MDVATTEIKIAKYQLWNDPDLKINWGIKKPILSKKDERASSLKKFLKDNK